MQIPGPHPRPRVRVWGTKPAVVHLPIQVMGTESACLPVTFCEPLCEALSVLTLFLCYYCGGGWMHVSGPVAFHSQWGPTGREESRTERWRGISSSNKYWVGMGPLGRHGGCGRGGRCC